MWTESDYNDLAIKEICYNCGSRVAKDSYNFFRRMIFVGGSKVWSKVWSKDGVPIAFFFANRSKDHVRLIEIAVKEDYKRQGIGKRMLSRLLGLMKEEGIDTLTFRTPIKEPAQYFWLKMGARIVDIKGEDYEMELKIKL